MILAFTLGLTGSLGHCVGMCSAVILMLKRRPGLVEPGWGWVLAHAGRLGAYMLIGAVAGLAGRLLAENIEVLQLLQGMLSFLMAAMAVYFSLAILGRVPSPDRAMKGLTAAWGRQMRHAIGKETNRRLEPLTLGLLWGFLPCGLVLADAFPAAASTSAPVGAARMLAFGLGTLPTLSGVHWLSSRKWRPLWPRFAAAAAMLLFGLQFIFRGLASWGLVGHLMMGEVMLW